MTSLSTLRELGSTVLKDIQPESYDAALFSNIDFSDPVHEALSNRRITPELEAAAVKILDFFYCRPSAIYDVTDPSTLVYSKAIEFFFLSDTIMCSPYSFRVDFEHLLDVGARTWIQKAIYCSMCIPPSTYQTIFAHASLETSLWIINMDNMQHQNAIAAIRPAIREGAWSLLEHLLKHTGICLERWHAFLIAEHGSIEILERFKTLLCAKFGGTMWTSFGNLPGFDHETYKTALAGVDVLYWLDNNVPHDHDKLKWKSVMSALACGTGNIDAMKYFGTDQARDGGLRNAFQNAFLTNAPLTSIDWLYKTNPNSPKLSELEYYEPELEYVLAGASMERIVWAQACGWFPLEFDCATTDDDDDEIEGSFITEFKSALSRKLPTPEVLTYIINHPTFCDDRSDYLAIYHAYDALLQFADIESIQKFIAKFNPHKYLPERYIARLWVCMPTERLDFCLDTVGVPWTPDVTYNWINFSDFEKLRWVKKKELTCAVTSESIKFFSNCPV